MNGLVNAPRRWYHRVATNLQNMRGEESPMEPCLWTASFMLCAWFTSMTSCWRAATLNLENMSLIVLTTFANGESGSHECPNSAAHKSHKHTMNTLENGADLRSVSQNTSKRFRSSTCHHIDAETRNPKSHPLKPSQLRALNGQLLWMVMHCLPGTSVAVDGTNTASHSGHDL